MEGWDDFWGFDCVGVLGLIGWFSKTKLPVLSNQPTVHSGGVSRGGVAVNVAVAVGFVRFGATTAQVKRFSSITHTFLNKGIWLCQIYRFLL